MISSSLLQTMENVCLFSKEFTGTVQPGMCFHATGIASRYIDLLTHAVTLSHAVD